MTAQHFVIGVYSDNMRFVLSKAKTRFLTINLFSQTNFYRTDYHIVWVQTLQEMWTITWKELCW